MPKSACLWVWVCAYLLSLALILFVHGGLAKTSPHIDLCEKVYLWLASTTFMSQNACVIMYVCVWLCVHAVACIYLVFFPTAKLLPQTARRDREDRHYLRQRERRKDQGPGARPMREPLLLGVFHNFLIVQNYCLYQVLLLIDIELSYINTNHEDFIGFAKYV